MEILANILQYFFQQRFVPDIGGHYQPEHCDYKGSNAKHQEAKKNEAKKWVSNFFVYLLPAKIFWPPSSCYFDL